MGGDGENLNFAAPSKLIAPLLANSNVQPLGAIPRSNSPSPPPVLNKETVWTSLASGRDYKLRIDGDYIYTEWVSLPTELQTTAAFVRAELKKDGDKWVGKVRSNYPYEYKSAYFDFWKNGQTVGTSNVRWCQLELDFEIDALTDSRIEGRAMGFTTFDAKKCKPGKMDWKPFTWIPK